MPFQSGWWNIQSTAIILVKLSIYLNELEKPFLEKTFSLFYLCNHYLIARFKVKNLNLIILILNIVFLQEKHRQLPNSYDTISYKKCFQNKNNKYYLLMLINDNNNKQFKISVFSVYIHIPFLDDITRKNNYSINQFLALAYSFSFL